MHLVVQVEEGDFLEIVTQTQRVVCHFYHRDFERCKLLDKHLTILARKYFDTRFIKLSAPVRPFFPHLPLMFCLWIGWCISPLGNPQVLNCTSRHALCKMGRFRVVSEHLSRPSHHSQQEI